MRIGVLKQQIDQATDGAKKMSVQGEPIYGGQAYKVSNFRSTRVLVRSLLDLGLVDMDTSPEEVKSLFGADDETDEFELNAPSFEQLNSFVAQINAILPTIYKPVKAFSPQQDERTINVKLPSTINNLAELNEINGRIQGIFQKIGLTDSNGLSFQGFDCGSEWYQFLIDDLEYFKWVVLVIGAAWAAVRIKKDWLESEIARLTLKALKKKQNKNAIDEEAVVGGVVESKIEEELESAFSAGLPLMGKKKDEVKNQLKMAIEAAIKEIELGAEFHLSLNPPKEISENDERNLTNINYKGIFQIPKQDNKSKAIPQNIVEDEGGTIIKS